MHNLKGRQSAMLETFSGTITLAQAHDLPEGGSPRNQNMDFSVGSVFTRQGLVNPFTYSENSAGPSPGGSAVDTPLGGAVWSNPGNVLLNTGVYATAELQTSITLAPALTCSNVFNGTWTNLANATSTSLFTSVVNPIQSEMLVSTAAASIPSAATITSISISFNSYMSSSASNYYLAISPVNTGATGQGPTLTTGDTSYSYTGLWGISWTPAMINAGFQFYINANQLYGGIGTVYLNSLVITVYYSLISSDAIDIKRFGFSLPATVTPQGLIIPVAGYATAPCMLNAQLLKASVPVGNIESTALNVGSVTTVTLGGLNDLFGANWVYSDLNNTAFGVRLTVSSSVACEVFLGYAPIEAYFLPTQVNYNYITTYEDNFGNIFNVALDADGDFWIENTSSNPGMLQPLFSGPPSGSFVNSFTASSRQYLAISNLLQGTYPPMQIVGTSAGQAGWQDRVSQVGPGAAPSFTGTLAPSATATITAYSTASDIVTLTASNSFTAGEVVNLFVTVGPTYLNNQRLNVLGTGLSTSAFEVSWAGATGSGSATGIAAPQYTYPIAASPNGITQYPSSANRTGGQSGFDGVLWSSGPGNTDAGNVITIYYCWTHGSVTEDLTLQNAFNSGKFPIYVYVQGCAIAVANGTFLVTGAGYAWPPNGASQERYYIQYSVASSGSQFVGNGSNSTPGTYQMTVATITTSLPLPGVQTGDSVTVSGDPVPSWDSTWTILDSLNSGSYSISQTSMTAGVASYNWALSGATTTPPLANQLVTVTGTLNGNGIFNVTDAVIATVTGSASGTFTIAGFASNLNYSTQTEVAQATTSGTQFQIDPGPLALGNTADDPIYGNSGGGYITLVGSSSVIVGTGTRKGTVFFITRNGFWTAPAAPVQFNTTENTNYILVSNIPIGPPNVVARGIAFTEAGGNGQPGASFYTIPQPVSFVYNGVTYLSSALIINDNTTTAAKFTFSDSVLLNAEEIDIQGNDLFALGELGDAAWCAQYAGRSVWGRVNNKIQNFVNLSFDGGYTPNPGANLIPLGWNLDTASNPTSSLPTLLVSPVFGNSYYINNQTGSTASALGMITQSAYQDWNNVAILQNQTAYSLRVTCRTPSSAIVGALVIDLTEYNSGSGYGQTYGSFTLNASTMTSNMVTYTGTLLTTEALTIPANLLLRVWAEGLLAGGDIEIDRIEIFPTLQPVNLTGLTLSYKDDWESFDQTTGGNDTSTVNAQPANGAFTIHDQLYIVKESSLGYLSDTPNQEPANWNPYREVSNVAGACGINAFDVGEEWAIMACQNGLFAFNGGAPMQIELEIPDLWQAINWNAGQTICLRNDVANRRILLAVPMTTPNQWCPSFPANTNPAVPNVVLMLNYDGIGSIEALMNAEPLHMTMMGKLAVHDLRRKWSLWSIATPYIGYCKRSELFSEMLFCNGIASSKIYALGSYQAGADDGTAFPQSYCTYGFVDQNKAEQNPAFGKHNKRYVYYDLLTSGNGAAQVVFYQNVLTAPYPFTVPGGMTLSSPAPNDVEGPLDELAQRLFVEISMQGVGNWFNLSRATLVAAADRWNPLRGF